MVYPKFQIWPRAQPGTKSSRACVATSHPSARSRGTSGRVHERRGAGDARQGVGEQGQGAMPPKAAPKAGAKEKSKADLAKKQKLVEDKTFGLKNKNKSKNVQKYVQSLHQSVQNAGPKRGAEDPKAAAKVGTGRDCVGCIAVVGIRVVWIGVVARDWM